MLLLRHEIEYMTENHDGYTRVFNTGMLDVYPYENTSKDVTVEMNKQGSGTYLISSYSGRYEYSTVSLT